MLDFKPLAIIQLYTLNCERTNTIIYSLVKNCLRIDEAESKLLIIVTEVNRFFHREAILLNHVIRNLQILVLDQSHKTHAEERESDNSK